MDTNDVKLLRELADREKIRQAIYRYALGVDHSDPQGVLSTFDDPCNLITYRGPGKPPKRYEGRAAVERFYNKAVINDMKLLRHRISSHLIELNGDEANARVYWDEIREQEGKIILGGGVYFDILRRVGDQWKFRERTAYSTYWITLIDKLEEQAANVLLGPRIKGTWGPLPI